jgi:hypothetical protein
MSTAIITRGFVTSGLLQSSNRLSQISGPREGECEDGHHHVFSQNLIDVSETLSQSSGRSALTLHGTTFQKTAILKILIAIILENNDKASIIHPLFRKYLHQISARRVSTVTEVFL